MNRLNQWPKHGYKTQYRLRQSYIESVVLAEVSKQMAHGVCHQVWDGTTRSIMRAGMVSHMKYIILPDLE